MFSFKDFGKQLLRILIYFLIFSLITTVFYYFNVIGDKVCSYVRLIGFIVIIYFNSSTLSRRVNANHFLHGVLLGLSIIFIFFILTLVMKYQFNFRFIIYYLLILLVSILGSAKRRKNKKR